MKSLSILLVLAATGFLVHTAVAKWNGKPQHGSTLSNARTLATGTDTLLLLFVSSSCGACSREPHASALRARVASLQGGGETRLRTVGVAIDSDVKRGQRFLSDLGQFDEISVGGGWTNRLALLYMFGDTTPIASVPQAIMIERQTSIVGSGAFADRVLVREHVLERRIGLPSINEFIASQIKRRLLSPDSIEAARAH